MLRVFPGCHLHLCFALLFFFRSSEDLYRAHDEIEQEQAKEMKLMPILEFTSINHL